MLAKHFYIYNKYKMLSVIIPCLEPTPQLCELTGQVGDFADEIIISGSYGYDYDNIGDAVKLVTGQKGRGAQLRRGAIKAKSDWLLFIHADSKLGKNWQKQVKFHIKTMPEKAGYFRLEFHERGIRPRLLSIWVWFRCLFFSMPYGDQGLLISRKLYDEIGGFSDLILFEDVDITRKIGKNSLRSLRANIYTSAIRYEREGYLRRGVKNLLLLRRFLRGEDVARLVNEYD